MTDRRFPRFDEVSAPPAAREVLAENKRLFGAIPEPLARYASSPALLEHALAGLRAFDATTLAPLEREVLAMTLGRTNGCGFCVSFHERLLRAQKAPADVVEALVRGVALPDARLEALRGFVLAVVEGRGDVSSAAWDAFLAAGFRHEQALEVVLGVGVYTVTTFANRLTGTSEPS